MAEDDHLLFSLIQKVPDTLGDELYLDLNEEFSVKAEILIENYIDMLDESTSKRLESFFDDPKKTVYLQKRGGLAPTCVCGL